MAETYHYHPVSMRYIGTSLSDENPLEPGVYLYPDFSTPISPPYCSVDYVWDTASNMWTNVPMPVEPVSTPDGMSQLRAERNKRLAEVDWVAIKHFTQGTPCPEEWANYVQALRDLPTVYISPPLLQNGMLDVNAIAWPSKPM